MAPNDPIGIAGETIADKYEIERVVGEGGFAVVYRAQHTIWRKPVAVKFFTGLSSAPEDEREELLREFIQEGALLTELSTQTAGIVQARDIGAYTTPAGQWVPYMVLEWLDGMPLDQILWRERQHAMVWSEEDVVGFLERVLPALEVAHATGIAHRDIKPPNLFVLGSAARSPSTPIKILDFGVAKMVSGHAHQNAALARTGANITAFTPQYGAPEQFTRSYGATGPWTDVYAIALVAVELLAGREALVGEDIVQLGYASADPRYRPTPRALGAHVSDEVERVFLKALAVHPQNRFAHAGEFLDAALAAIGQERPRSGRQASRSSGPALSPRIAEPVAAPMASRGSNPTVAGATLSQRRDSKVPLIAVILIALAGATAVFSVSELEGAKETRDVLLSVAKTAEQVAAKFRPPPTRKTASKTHPSDAVATATAPPLECPPTMALIVNKAADADPSRSRPPPAPYCVDINEVTAGQYKACMATTRCEPANSVLWRGIKRSELRRFSRLCTTTQPGQSRFPVNCVSWEMAERYCQAQDKRLPSAAEWELAAAGPSRSPYPWGSDDPSALHLNACGAECAEWGEQNGIRLKSLYATKDGHPTLAEVGTFKKGRSPFGLFDMAGNVAEWVADLDSKPTIRGQERRGVRGGAWDSAAQDQLRTDSQSSEWAEARSHRIGFRCAKAASPARTTP